MHSLIFVKFTEYIPCFFVKFLNSNRTFVSVIPKFNIGVNLKINKMCDQFGTQAPRLRFLTAITSNRSAIISNSLALRAL